MSIVSALKGVPLNGADTTCKDRKDSDTQKDPAFAIFDNQEFGPGFTTSPCTKDNECCTSCCDGKKCRAPDALKGDETCRSGLKPDFTNGLKFVGGNDATASGTADAAGADTEVENVGVNATGGAGADTIASGDIDLTAMKAELDNIRAELDDIQRQLDGADTGTTSNATADAKANANSTDAAATGKINRGGTCTKNALGGDQGGLNGIPVTPDALNCQDRKDSKCNGQGFAVFDDLPFGGKFITSPCTKDEECCTSCCDGKKCRAPDALKGAETCRNGLKPQFDAQGQISFVKE